MKAKNVSKHVGKEVYIKVPLEQVTSSCVGADLADWEIERLANPPLTISTGYVYDDGDVALLNRYGCYAYVNHKFIKLVK